MKDYFLILTLSIPLMLLGCNIHTRELHWGYEGDRGPEHWWRIKPEYSICRDGKNQSPVNIAEVEKADLTDIEFSYQDTSLKIIKTDYTVFLKYPPGSTFNANGRTYELIQFHFHAPSEHTVEKHTYAMEAHLVHTSPEGEPAVLGIFFVEGKYNNALGTLWENLPPKNVRRKISRKIIINAADLLPDDKTYFHYTGSLTTPPCNEGVKWYIMKTPVEASHKQISTFTSLFPQNTRPVQPLNDRVIQLSR